MTKPKPRVDRLTLTLLSLALLYGGMYLYEQRQTTVLFPAPVSLDGCVVYKAGQAPATVLICDSWLDVPPQLESVGYVRLTNSREQRVCPAHAQSWDECQTTIIRFEKEPQDRSPL